MNRFLPGYPGHDSMREKAERMLRTHVDHAAGPENMPTKHVGRISHFKKGGHVKHHEHEHHSHHKKHHGHKKHNMHGEERLHREHGNILKHLKHVERLEERESHHGRKKHHYRHGGHVHGLQHEQTDLHLPKHLKHSAHRAEGGEMKRGGHAHKHHKKHMNIGGMLEALAGRRSPGIAPAMKRGGHAHKKHHYAAGGFYNLPNMAPPSPVGLARMAASGMKKGGHAHKHHKKHHYAEGGYAHGGDVYEHEMVGEHPTHAMHHYNYESIMRGEHPRSVPRRTHHAMAGRDDETQGQDYKRHGGHVKKMAMGGIGKIRHKAANSRGHQIGKKLDLSR